MNEHPAFREWDATYAFLKRRQDFHDALRGKYPDDHPIVVLDIVALDDARVAYEKVFAKL